MKNLSELFDSAVQETVASMREVPWQNAKPYGAWLTQTYHLVKHTTRLICLAAGNMPMQARGAHYDWIGHLKGELNHDQVAVKDLEALGLGLDAYPELPEIQLIIQSQYYFLDRGSALALSGYALLLEGIAAHYGPSTLPLLEKAHGKKATSFVRLHCMVDVDHYADGLKSLSHVTGVEDQKALEKNLNQSVFLYKSMIEAVKTNWASNEKPAAHQQLQAGRPAARRAA